ncbi:hypothetical protein LMG19282_03838 [Cupriavidus campinensis]|jgi:hypothetical protein|uniref:TniB family NTP-binding protein n=1 Tax=Cupriavidus campinensis TaxID=151783 RepID=A0AAE9L1L3_9BURK|nr:TniB family NTP-binding protein [Cupriavidus campinensis]URF04003.1 TniB family NTP-binding protein [Cupriavidus campinensis]CAG2150735.1 hypothetical protein LMG19282_03838 [Cupriavidus campinensis]
MMKELGSGLLDLRLNNNTRKISTARERELALNGSASDREEFVFKVVVRTPQVKMIDECVTLLVDAAGRVPFPGGFCVTGEGGTGKSALLEYIKRRFPEEDSYFVSKRTVVEIKLPERPTPRGIAQMIMRALGNDLWMPSLDQLDARSTIVRALAACETRLLLIDEAHHLTLTSGPRKNEARLMGVAGDFLKILHDVTRIPMGFFALPVLDAAFDRDSQLRSRFPGRLHLYEYKLDATWRQLLVALDKALPLPETSDLAQPHTASMLHRITSGNLRELKRVLGRAVYVTTLEGGSRISNKTLQRLAKLVNMESNDESVDPCEAN